MRVAAERAVVRVPATSGNLGPGFDCMGMAHGIWDEVEARLVMGPTRVEIFGQGSDTLPRDDDHLIVQALRAGLEHCGVPATGVRLTSRNRIPQGKGLGSSAAAVVAGLLLAKAFIQRDDYLDNQTLLTLATRFEGHPDNAAPAIYGGAVVTWVDSSGARAIPLTLHPEIQTSLLIPDAILPTSTARAALPERVPHTDAAFNASRTALLTWALEHDPSLLVEATRDRLHQEYRASSMPGTAQVLRALRDAGWPAVVSGAGPAILVLDELDSTTASILQSRGFRVHNPGIARGGHITEVE